MQSETLTSECPNPAGLPGLFSQEKSLISLGAPSFHPPLTSRIQHPFTNQSAFEGVGEMEPQMPRDREEASPRVPGEQADRRGVGRRTSRSLVPSAYRRLTQADPHGPESPLERSRCQRRQLRMTLEEKIQVSDVLERTRGTWLASPCPYSLELQRPVGESHLETMRNQKP